MKQAPLGGVWVESHRWVRDKQMGRDQCRANKDRKLTDLETQRPEIALYKSEKK